MASTKVREHSDRGIKDLKRQPNRFLGLFLAPFAGLLTSWLIHVWTLGVNLHLGPLSWVVRASSAAPYVAVSLITAATIGLAVLGWRFTDHRKPELRGSLAGSIAAVGALFSINVGTGPDYWWSGLFVLGGWAVAVIWSVVRLDVTRNDRREGDGEEREDGLLKKLGISKLTRFRPKVITDEQTGEPLRVEVDVQHAPGETVSVLQNGIANLESVVAGPGGMSTAIGDPDHADQSKVTLMLTNPFKRNIPVGPLTAPGGSIADYACVADYADGQPAMVTTAPGKHMAGATSYGLIGTTRAGKTGTETQLITEWGSRIDWVCLYLNQAKGLQDIRPLLPVIEAAVIAENGEAGLGDYVLAFQKLKAMMTYRQQQLAMYGVSAWSPRCADPDPARRPSRLTALGREVMEPMPFLTAHVGEADAILDSGRAGDLAVYIASKGLSLGVNTGWSLQRPDWKAMPTGLRANIGLWFIHGLSASDDEDFVLDASVREAGAHPGAWGARKPGQHIMTGPGIDESRFPIALKTRFLVGSETLPDGSKIDFDTLNDRYMAEMLRRNMTSASGMAKLDRGSAEATEGWWDEQVAKTADLRARMLNPQAPATTPQPATRKPAVFAGAPAPRVADEDTDEMDPQEMEELMDEFDEEAANTTEVEGVQIYGDDPQEAAAIRGVDLTAPFRPPATDFDPLADGGEDEKPEARTAEEARQELRRSLVAMLADPRFADPKVPGTAIVTPGQVFDFCRLRSRPWTSAELTRIMLTGGEVEDGVLMERIGDPAKGKYRIQPTDVTDHRK